MVIDAMSDLQVYSGEFLLVNCHSFDLVVDTSHSGIVNILGEQN